MSVQMDCPKCGKFIGSVFPTDDADWEKVIDDFSKMFSRGACDNIDECYYHNNDIKSDIDIKRKAKLEQGIKEIEEYLKDLEDE